MSISAEQVELLLASTVSSDEASIRSATASLQSAESVPGFPFILLAISSGGTETGKCLAAATYLKNVLKAQWHKADFMPASERCMFRNQLVDVLLRADLSILKTLVEAFHAIFEYDFVQTNNWPDLIPAMKTAIQMSNLIDKTGTSEIRLYNALLALQAMVKPFRYFMNPKLAREPVPEQLELISRDLLNPALQVFHALIEEVKLNKGHDSFSRDGCLLVLCKSLHLAVRSHMPSSLIPYLDSLCEDLLLLLQCVEVQVKLEGEDKLLRMKCWKRALQIFCTLVTRHRRYVEKYFAKIASVLMDLVKAAALAKDVHPMQERVISSAFDAIANILETGPGWRLISLHFSSLLGGAIFPALRLKEKDIVDWNEDHEEYLRKNLPSDMDDATGWRTDFYTPRRSALNLLGLISTAKGPPTYVAPKQASATKRKKAGKSGKSKDSQGLAGDLFIIPFLSKFPIPPENCVLNSELLINYYGALLAYGGLQEFLKVQRPDYLLILVQNRVLCLYKMQYPSPFLLANANWVLGQFATCLPEEISKDIYDALLKAFLAPDVGDLSWAPVRTSAAAALCALLEEAYKPAEWLPLLQATVTGGRSENDDEASAAFQVLSTAANVLEEEIVPHLPAIISAVRADLYNRIPPIPEPWPQVVESGVTALVALAQSWDCAGAEEGEGAVKPSDWETGCLAVGNTISDLLQQAWLIDSENTTNQGLSAPPSCLNDTSSLLAVMIKYANEANLIEKWRIERILQAWSGLIAEWSAWDEEEDLAVFDAIKEIASLQGKFPLPHFAVAAIPPPPAVPVRPRSILEGIATFVSSAIEASYPAATWRACRIGHSLLHVSRNSFESEEITPALSIRFSQASLQRLMQLSHTKAPLAKPLVLLIGACFVCCPNATAQVLSQGDAVGSGMLAWGEALADISLSEEGPGITLESELKVAVAVVLKMLEELCSEATMLDSKMLGLRHKLTVSLLTLSIRLKDLQDVDEESKDEDDDGEDEEDDEETDEDTEDSEDDEKLEETEDQFLERYARKAQELEKGLEEAEGEDEEDGCEIEIGVLGLTDQMPSVYIFLQKFGKKLMSESAVPHTLVAEFVDKFPDSAAFFQ